MASLALPARAADFSAWPQRQEVVVPSAGLVKMALPTETLGACQPRLQDLRIVSPTGQELPCAILRPRPKPGFSQAPKRFDTVLEGKTTVVTLETGVSAPLDGVMLFTPATSFIKAVEVETSDDGNSWQPLVKGQPIFRQGGVSRLEIKLPKGVRPHLRLKISDTRSEAIGFTGATLSAVAEETSPVEASPATVTERENGPDQTRWVLNLGAANLDVASVEFEVSDPLFMRRVSVAVRQVSENAVREQIIAEGSIYRVAVDGLPPSSGLVVSLERQVTVRDLVILVQNDDNPPLDIQNVRVWRRPVQVAWMAREPGAHALLCGHPRAAAPRYDLASFGANLGAAALSDLRWTTLAANPGYVRPEDLPEIQDLGAAIELADWRRRKPVKLAAAGVQQVELDYEVMSKAQRGFNDLRLVREDRQVPYVLEHPSITREIKVAARPEQDPKKPKESRWTLQLPAKALPLQRLICESPTPLFRRDMRLYERVEDNRGESYERTLGSASWTQTPDRKSRTFSLNLQTPPTTDTLVLATDNGDNLAIELTNFRLTHSVTRVLFKASSPAPLELYFDNPKAAAPSYDLSLVAPQLLAADRTPAVLGTVVVLKESLWGERAAGKGGVLFWGVLALVVAGLLLLIKRLIPHSAPGA